MGSHEESHGPFEIVVTPEQRAAARRTVAANAFDAAEAAEMMRMLGINPDQDGDGQALHTELPRHMPPPTPRATLPLSRLR